MTLFDSIEYEGLRIQLFWNELDVGYSFFIPCLDTVEMLHVIYTEAKDRGYTLTHQETIECGKTGIRFWRLANETET
jgi:hypothetical protein